MKVYTFSTRGSHQDSYNLDCLASSKDKLIEKIKLLYKRVAINRKFIKGRVENDKIIIDFINLDNNTDDFIVYSLITLTVN